MSRMIQLDPHRITNKQDMAAYMRENLDLPDYFGGNLDALYDCLSEYTEDVVFTIDRMALREITFSGYSYRVLRVLEDSTRENDHIGLRFI